MPRLEAIRGISVVGRLGTICGLGLGLRFGRRQSYVFGRCMIITRCGRRLSLFFKRCCRMCSRTGITRVHERKLFYQVFVMLATHNFSIRTSMLETLQPQSFRACVLPHMITGGLPAQHPGKRCCALPCDDGVRTRNSRWGKSFRRSSKDVAASGGRVKGDTQPIWATRSM